MIEIIKFCKLVIRESYKIHIVFFVVCKFHTFLRFTGKYLTISNKKDINDGRPNMDQFNNNFVSQN